MTTSLEKLPSVIFAEDDDDTLTMYRVYGESIGWDIETAVSAGELLEKVNERFELFGTTFDAVVTDINFMNAAPSPQPRMTGFSAAAVIRKAFPDLPIIVVTAYSSFIVNDELKKISADIIKKPIEIDYVFSKIQTQIDFMRQTRPDYCGDERRRALVNQTDYARRKSDRRLEVSRPLRNVMTTMRARAHFQE